MPLQAKVLSGGRSFKSIVSPVISVTIHSDIQRALIYIYECQSDMAKHDTKFRRIDVYQLLDSNYGVLLYLLAIIYSCG